MTSIQSRRIADWMYRRIRYHRNRFEAEHERYAILASEEWVQDEIDGTWHKIYDGSGYPSYDYITESWYDFLEWLNVCMLAPYDRSYKRTQMIKEELIAAVYHPSRVEKWLEAGEHVLEMMF